MSATHVKRFLARLTLVGGGLMIGLATIELGMRSAGDLIRRAQRQRNQAALQREHDFRVLCLGESTTEGTSEDGRYPEMLADILNRQGLGVRVAVLNQGLAGAVTQDIIGLVDEHLDELAPDLVVVMMGINDAGKTYAYGSIIAPGSQHWYGSFRLYKLYRLVRTGLERRFEPSPEDRLLPVSGLIAPAGSTAGEGAVAASRGAEPPPPSLQVSERLLDARGRVARREYQAAEEILDRLLDEHPGLIPAQVQLARVYAETDRGDDADRLLTQAAAAATTPDIELFETLAVAQQTRGENDKAIETLRRLVDLLDAASRFAEEPHFRMSLADLYERTGRADLAEQQLLFIVERAAPGNDVLYQPLIDFYERHDRPELAVHHRRIQERIRQEYVNPTTRDNYRALKEKLLARGIPLVAVQYPMRSVEALARLLDGDPRVLYVDNGFFMDLVERDGYERYFIDRFAGDFGHFTRRGHYLLARSVARVITEQFFGVPFAADADEDVGDR